MCPHRALRLLGRQRVVPERARLVATRTQPSVTIPRRRRQNVRLDIARALAQRAEHDLQQRHVGLRAGEPALAHG